MEMTQAQTVEIHPQSILWLLMNLVAFSAVARHGSCSIGICTYSGLWCFIPFQVGSHNVEWQLRKHVECVEFVSWLYMEWKWAYDWTDGKGTVYTTTRTMAHNPYLRCNNCPYVDVYNTNQPHTAQTTIPLASVADSGSRYRWSRAVNSLIYPRVSQPAGIADGPWCLPGWHPSGLLLLLDRKLRHVDGLCGSPGQPCQGGPLYWIFYQDWRGGNHCGCVSVPYLICRNHIWIWGTWLGWILWHLLLRHAWWSLSSSQYR